MVVKTKDEVLLKRIDQLLLSDKLRLWKEATLEAEPRICTERAELAAQSKKKRYHLRRNSSWRRSRKSSN